jgi:peptidoglycan/xylan/chitin deacetylase (PgdA/CDA1 family)
VRARIALAILPLTACAHPPPRGAPIVEAIEVAVTVDDLPRHGPEVPGLSRLLIHRVLLDAFHAHRLPPVYGFVNDKSLWRSPENRAALEAWVAAGNPLGNHTRSHFSLEKTPVATFLGDLEANEATLRALQPKVAERTWRVFRYPFLREGADLASRAAFREHLARRGYRIAPVTIDFEDWAWNAPYARCLARQDRRALAALERSFLESASVFLHWADAAARALFGRRIPHVLVLHAGAFDAHIIDKLLALYEARRVRFVSLEYALADPVYASEPQPPKIWAGTFLRQVRAARGQLDPPQPGAPEALLEALCR